MKILVIGGGGREHALAWRLRRCPGVEHVWCAPGNGGIEQEAECVPADLSDVASLVELAKQLRPDLTVVGPEMPLVLGIADEFARHGLRVFGPTKNAARLEGSKVFAKEFLERHAIPTAVPYGVYDAPGDAYSALCAVDWPVVVKADGLCAGKGVLVTASPDEATSFIERLMVKREFGDGGGRILLEEALEGREISYIVLTDGERIVPMLPACDHKRALDGDQGPNTGGMGSYTADGTLAKEAEEAILETIVRPTIAGMGKEGSAYRGFLYFGLMLTPSGPKVLEFNCRMGDPEAQAILVRMDSDLAKMLLETAEGKLSSAPISWRPGASVCVVVASGGYPGPFEVGKQIDGLPQVKEGGGLVVFHAGTKRANGVYYTNGGRVLGISATGRDLSLAARSAYDALSRICFDNLHYRKDIGAASLKRSEASGE